jgi:dihydrorhizobitoxine desaturase
MVTLTWAHTGRRYTMYRFSPDIEREIKKYNVSDNWHALFSWAHDLVWMALCVAACYAVTWWLYPLAVLIIGARQRGLSTILHDCAHGVGAASKRLQMIVGTVMTAYPIFQQHYAYKVSHVYTHHPKLGDPSRDPDLQFFIEQKAYTPASHRRYIGRAVVLPALGTQTLAYLRYLIRNRYRVIKGAGQAGGPRAGGHVPRRKRVLDKIAFWIFWATVLGVAWRTGGLAAVALFWVVPYLTSFQILGWYIELSEHTPLVRDYNIDLYMTRNRKSRGLERFLTGIHNDHFHLDHHLDPRTPFWNLPKAHRARMADPSYAALDARTGGLWRKGPQGVRSAMATIVAQMTSEQVPGRAAA